MILQAASGKVSACKSKEHRPIPLALRVSGNGKGECGGRREDDASGWGALALAICSCPVN